MSDLNEIHEEIQNQIINVDKTIKNTHTIINIIDRSKKRESFNTISSFCNSDFRYSYFKYRQEFVNSGFGEGALYKQVLSNLRIYLTKHNLYLADGFIQCDEFLKLHLCDDKISFFKLAAGLRRILQ
jgi:hypothetical protein